MLDDALLDLSGILILEKGKKSFYEENNLKLSILNFDN